MPAIRFYRLRDTNSPRYKQYRTAIIFENNLQQLSHFIKIHGRYPGKDEDGHLHLWISSQRAKKKNNTLEDIFEQQLDSIGFIWNKSDIPWNRKLDDIKRLLSRDNNLTLYEMDSSLFHWLKGQKKLSTQNLLSNERNRKLTGLLFWIEEISKEANRVNVLKWPNPIKNEANHVDVLKGPNNTSMTNQEHANELIQAYGKAYDRMQTVSDPKAKVNAIAEWGEAKRKRDIFLSWLKHHLDRAEQEYGYPFPY